MSSYGTINTKFVGQIGDRNYYRDSKSEFVLIQFLSDELKKLQSASSLQPSTKQELNTALSEIDASLIQPTQSSLKEVFTKLTPSLRPLLSSIGTSVTSDVIVAVCKHAIEHLDAIQSFLHL